MARAAALDKNKHRRHHLSLPVEKLRVKSLERRSELGMEGGKNRCGALSVPVKHEQLHLAKSSRRYEKGHTRQLQTRAARFSQNEWLSV